MIDEVGRQPILFVSLAEAGLGEAIDGAGNGAAVESEFAALADPTLPPGKERQCAGRCTDMFHIGLEMVRRDDVGDAQRHADAPAEAVEMHHMGARRARPVLRPAAA